jgi:hypothetical protein
MDEPPISLAFVMVKDGFVIYIAAIMLPYQATLTKIGGGGTL